MNNYILITNDKNIKFDNIEDIMKHLLGDDYYTLSEEQRFIRRYENAFNSIMMSGTKENIVHTLLGVIEDNYKAIQKEYNLKTDFIIDTDITYLLSLCRLNKFLLLEKVDSNNIIPKDFDKEHVIIENNFIIINKYINRLMIHHTLQEFN